MTLIKCSECKNEVSDQAKACQHSGAKVIKHQSALQTFSSIALFLWIWLALPNYSNAENNPLPEHTIKYQTKGTLHLQAKNSNLTKEQCLDLIQHYQYEATHQIAVYKLSPLTKTFEPWCIINKLDPDKHEAFFNDMLFE